MPVELPNIDFRKPSKNPTIDAETSPFELPFYKDNDYFVTIDNFVGFIRAVEKQVRTSVYYSRYISYLKQDVGLTACQVLSSIQDDDDGSYKGGPKHTLIEMHHGPILTLFDYVAIITDHLLYNNKKVNTFIVSDILLEEHFRNRIQVVMLSKTVHEQVHENNIFINLKQAFGDLTGFVKKYGDGLQTDHIKKINKYIEKSKSYDSYDNNVLSLEGAVKKWNKELYE
jgi:hypothetical protein